MDLAALNGKSPVKLHIRPLSPSELTAFDVPFNPNAYSIVKPVAWTDVGSAVAPSDAAECRRAATNRELDAPPQQFDGGGARSLTLQLFFDVTEGGADADVRTETNKIVKLTRIEREHGKPPVCEITWGSAEPTGSDFPFIGVVTNLTQNFVMFRANGKPVRANLTVVFTEFIDPVKNRQETDPDLTTYVVKRADTLSAIAARLYRNPTQWRAIAVANEIDDPRHLQIGARLAIPKTA